MKRVISFLLAALMIISIMLSSVSCDDILSELLADPDADINGDNYADDIEETSEDSVLDETSEEITSNIVDEITTSQEVTTEILQEETSVNLCVDEEPIDHICDDCGMSVSTCEDNNSDHDCDICGNACGLEFILSEDGKYYIVSGIGGYTKKELVIPEESRGIPVKEIKKSAFSDNLDIYSVILPNTIVTIGTWAFGGCYNIISVTLGTGLKSIGDYAFNNCEKLVEVINLSSLDISSNNKNGMVGFYSEIIHRATSKIVNVDDYIFLKHPYEASYYLLGYIGDDTELVLPESYNGHNYYIYEYAFYRNYNITSVTLPEKIQGWGGYSFAYCFSLETVYVGDITQEYISMYTFQGCANLKQVNIPDKVTTIAQYAFAECTNLASINIPDSVKVIERCAFSQCTNLANVVMGDGVTEIGVRAFEKCENLTSITIPDGVTELVPQVFSMCLKLTDVVLGRGVNKIDTSAFDSCRDLKNVYCSVSESRWRNVIIEGDSNSRFSRATKYFYSETQPTTTGNCWHYVDGVPTVW